MSRFPVDPDIAKAKTISTEVYTSAAILEEAKEKISETVETAKEKVNNLIHDGSEDAKETVENTTNRIEEDAD